MDSPAPSHKWSTLLAAGGALAMLMIDATGTSVALPSIQRDLGLDQGSQQWVITIYALTLAVAITTGGRLGDIFGRVRVFATGVVLFAMGSILSGLAPDLPVLLCGRLIEGCGNILMAPAAAVLATDAFGPAERGRAMGLYTALGGLAMMCGPVIGGALVQHVSWRAVFFVNVPLAVATLMMLRVAKPADPKAEGARLNIRHSLLLVAALTAVVLALQESHNWSWTSPLTLGLIGLGLVLLAVFTRTQLHTADPLVDVRLLANRQFAADGIVLYCAQFSTVGHSAYAAIYLQRILGFSPMQTGLAMLLFLTPLMILAPISGRLYDRFGVKVPAVLGLSLTTLGFFIETQALPHCDFKQMIPAMVLIGAGLGLAISQTYTDGMSRVSPDRRGGAFGTLDTLRQLGGAMGMAAIGTVVASQERIRVIDIAARTVPAGPDVEKLQNLLAQAAYGKVEAAHAVMAQWPEAAEALRLSGARSIADGYFVGVSVMAVGLVLAFLLMKRKPAVETQVA